MSRTFELREHTADVGVAGTGGTLEEVFAALADGLAAACCEDVPEGGGRFDLSVTAERPEALLFDYLDELIYLRDVRDELPVDNRVATIDHLDDGEWSLEASARGVPLSEIDAREVKAVTYSEMRLEEGPNGWEAYVVLDV